VAYTIASSVAGAASTGGSCQGHLCWAANQGAYWCFYPLGTQSLSAAYASSPSGTWTNFDSTPFGLAVAHGSEGRGFGFAYASLGGADVLHMFNAPEAQHPRHSRFTLGSSWTNTNAETIVGSTTVQAGGTPAAATGLDSTGLPIDGGEISGGNQYLLRATNTDAGSSWTAGFGTGSSYNLTGPYSSSAAMIPFGSGNMLPIVDNAASNSTFTNLFYWTWSGSSWGTQANVFASSLTTTSASAWGAVARTTSDIHVVALSNNSNAYTHRRFNGTSWSNGDTVPTLTYGTTSGVSLVSDGTSVWMAVIDSSGNVNWIKWVSGTGWVNNSGSGSWTQLEASNSNTRGYLTGAYSPTRSEILWAWTENVSGTYYVKGQVLSTSGGGTNTYTLTAAAGSYSLSGIAASLTSARTLGAAKGTYALTGLSAAMPVTRVITAAAGSYALAGQSASMLRGRVLPASAGTYTLSGQSAALTSHRTLATSAGVYTLTGEPATLTTGKVYTLTAAAGTYSLTGQSVSMLRGRALIAAEGSYILAGQPAGLNSSRSLVAAAGSYILTGEPATLTAAHGYTLAASAGSYALTGQPATFGRSISLVAAPGSYTLTGQSATLTYVAYATSTAFGATDPTAATLTIHAAADPTLASSLASSATLTVHAQADPTLASSDPAAATLRAPWR
jgi:hypothetical protein